MTAFSKYETTEVALYELNILRKYGLQGKKNGRKGDF